jgi:hypothetical protein
MFLTGKPGAKYRVVGDRTGEVLKAKADGDGILRDEDGEPFWEEAYSIQRQ